MRWEYIEPKDGEIRVINKLLLWPLTLPVKPRGDGPGDTNKWYRKETRWLDIVGVEQEYVGPSTYDEGHWVDKFFAD